MRETSLQAFEEIRSELGERQKDVYNALKELKEATNTMLSKKLSIPINQVTPRTNELVKMDLVEESYKDLCPITKRKCIFWRIKCQNLLKNKE